MMIQCLRRNPHTILSVSETCTITVVNFEGLNFHCVGSLNDFVSS